MAYRDPKDLKYPGSTGYNSESYKVGSSTWYALKEEERKEQRELNRIINGSTPTKIDFSLAPAWFWPVAIGNVIIMGIVWKYSNGDRALLVFFILCALTAIIGKTIGKRK